MSLSICPRCQYRFPLDLSHCPECHRGVDGEENRAEERRKTPREEASPGPYCPYCGSNKISRVRGLDRYREYLTLTGFLLLCFALAWIIPILVMIPVAMFFLYIRTSPHCRNCDRRDLHTVDRWVPPSDRQV